MAIIPGPAKEGTPRGVSFWPVLCLQFDVTYAVRWRVESENMLNVLCRRTKAYVCFFFLFYPPSGST